VLTGQPGVGKSAVLARAALSVEAGHGGPGLAFQSRVAEPRALRRWTVKTRLHESRVARRPEFHRSVVQECVLRRTCCLARAVVSQAVVAISADAEVGHREDNASSVAIVTEVHLMVDLDIKL